METNKSNNCMECIIISIVLYFFWNLLLFEGFYIVHEIYNDKDIP